VLALADLLCQRLIEGGRGRFRGGELQETLLKSLEPLRQDANLISPGNIRDLDPLIAHHHFGHDPGQGHDLVGEEICDQEGQNHETHHGQPDEHPKLRHVSIKFVEHAGNGRIAVLTRHIEQ
jgi:hypothetical protein